MPNRTPAAPRKPILLGLVVAVLALHLWLLAGGLPGSGLPTPGAATAAPHQTRPLTESRQRTEAPSPPFAESALPPDLNRAAAVTVSAVRWVIPPPPSKAPDAPTVPAAAPRPPAPIPAPPAPPPPPPQPDTTVAQIPAPETETPPPAEPPQVIAVATPAEAPALMDTPPPAPSGPAEENPGALPTPPDDTLIAAGPASAPTATAPRAPLATAVPGSVVLLYDIQGKTRRLGYSADAELRWDTDGQRYNATLEIKALLVGSRIQTSRGRITAQGLAPERFGDKRRNTEKAAHFDAAGQRIRFSSNAPDAPLLPGTQDRLSVFLQLATLLQARPQADGQGLKIPVAGTGGAEEWHFRVGELQALTLPAGTVSARKLTREPRHEHDSRVEIWLATELQHLPVRIRVTEPDGSYADQLLRQLPLRVQ